VEAAKRYGVTLGAHPGFPDKMGFGRRLMNITQQEARDYVVYQVNAVKAFAEAAGDQTDRGQAARRVLSVGAAERGCHHRRK